jgi:hypothetical protein
MDGKRTASRLPWFLAGLVLAIVFAAAGVLVASRVSANPIGWLLLVPGTGTTIAGTLPIAAAEVST